VPIFSVSGKINSGVSFHQFAKDESVRAIWVRNIRHDNLVIRRYTTVCSQHFMPEDLLEGPDAIWILERYRCCSSGTTSACLLAKRVPEDIGKMRMRSWYQRVFEVSWLWLQTRTSTLISGSNLWKNLHTAACQSLQKRIRAKQQIQKWKPRD